MLCIDTMTWYNKYVGFNYQHLGENPDTGIDCFNLCRHVLRQELGVQVPLASHDFCNIVDDDWFQKTNQPLFELGAQVVRDDFSWIKVTSLQPFDILTMSFGSTNITNHCALYVDKDKILQIMLGKPSWIGPYGRYYKQYTTGMYRWKSLNN
jgi:cell wall-associated NlpC family hydrolase